MDYARFLNDISLGRKPSPIREITKFIKLSPVPILNLAAGVPNLNTYPFKSFSVNLKDGKTITVDGDLLANALEYGPSDGYPNLKSVLREYQKRLHNPPMEHGDWSTAVTCGSQDGLSKTFEMVVNDGDYVVSEEYLYPGVIAILRPYSVRHLRVKGDQHGMIPESLREVLSQWEPEDIRKQTHGIPKVLYIVPHGGNPVATSTTAERKREIYKIAQLYNLLIMEDDPYYFLQYNERSVSFLSMDVDGRVLRFDSFSKILSGGLRVGFVTGPQQLVQQIVLHIQAAQLQVSSLTQVIVHELLMHWSFEGFLDHSEKIASFYQSRCNVMLKYADKWLKGLAEWSIPDCGMFLWIHVPAVKDTRSLINNGCMPKQVCFLPGHHCTLDDSPTPYIRVSFSYPTEEEMDRGLYVLAEAIREEIAKQN